MVKNTYFECDNCNYKVMIDSDRLYCEENEYTIKYEKCWYCKHDFCQDCLDLDKLIKIDSCGHYVCLEQKCIDKHNYNCPSRD
jgi:hypothetical protein